MALKAMLTTGLESEDEARLASKMSRMAGKERDNEPERRRIGGEQDVNAGEEEGSRM